MISASDILDGTVTLESACAYLIKFLKKLLTPPQGLEVVLYSTPNFIFDPEKIKLTRIKI